MNRCTQFLRPRPLSLFSQKPCSSLAADNDIVAEKFREKSAKITMPFYLSKKLVKVREKKLEKFASHKLEYGVDTNRDKIIIECQNNSKLRHYEGQKYPPNKPVPLVTEFWHKKSYCGSVLVVKSTLDKNPSLVKLQASAKNYQSDEQFDSFKDFDFCEQLQSVLDENFDRTTRAQSLAIPRIMRGQNLILAAETGSGKTLAYLAPLIHKLHLARSRIGPPAPDQPRTIILAPNLELCSQIFNVLREYSAKTNVQSVKFAGSSSTVEQGQIFDVAVSTPGLLRKLLKSGDVSFDSLSTAIIDEADTLLDDTFRDLIASIFENISFRSVDLTSARKSSQSKFNSGVCQLILISATFPENLDSFLAGLPDLSNFERVRSTDVHQLQRQVSHRFVRVRKSNRPENMLILAKKECERRRSCIVFVNDGKTGNFLYHFLRNSNVPCEFLRRSVKSSRPTTFPEETLEILHNFQNERTHLLIATDLGSRGLDTSTARHVINYNFPRTLAEYLHRAGRLGRATPDEKKIHYLATSFVADQGDVALVQKIELAVRLNDGRFSGRELFENVKQNFAIKLHADKSVQDGSVDESEKEEDVEEYFPPDVENQESWTDDREIDFKQ